MKPLQIVKSILEKRKKNPFRQNNLEISSKAKKLIPRKFLRQNHGSKSFCQIFHEIKFLDSNQAAQCGN